MDVNMKAFLDTLAWSEGTSTSKYTLHDGYDIIVDGLNSPHTFANFARHPNVLVTVNTAGLKSTAAGRYQQVYRWWLKYQKLLKLANFSPASQDAVAIQQIKEQGAYQDVLMGRISLAISKCSDIWASLPGNSYGQLQHPPGVLVVRFETLGGVVSA